MNALYEKNKYSIFKYINWRGGRVVEGARLESVYRGNSIMGSNPILSANIDFLFYMNLEIKKNQPNNV